MALRLWLPLNGTNANNGLSDITMSGVPTSWQNGPTGKCASFNNNTGHVIYSSTTELNFTTQDFSWAVWINKISASMTTSAMFAFTVGRADAGGYGYGLQVDGSTLRCWFGSYTALVSSVPDNEWHHIAFVKSGDNIKVYRDGTCVVNATRTGNLPTYSDGAGPGIGCFHYASGNIYPLIGHLSEFRIYDHALTAKEVKELSLGLVMHYKLDNPYTCGVTNMLNATSSKGGLGESHFTRTALYKESGYKFTRSYTGTSSNAWFFIRSENLSKASFTVGKTYVWSCKYRVNCWNAGTFTFRHACKTNDTTTGGAVAIADPSKADGQWHLIALSYTITQAIYDDSSFAPLIEFVSSNLNSSGTAYQFDIDIKECQIVEADDYPGWINNDLTRTYVSNSTSAFAGTFPLYLSGKCKPVSGKDARNLVAYDFNQTGYFYHGGLDLALTKFTIAFWFNARTNANQHFIVGAFDSWDQNGIGIYRDPNKNYYSGRMKGGSTSSIDLGGGAAVFSFNTWNHWAVTWDGSNIRIYLNGVLKNTTAYSANGACAIGSLYLGNSKFNNTPASETEECAMSDFRLYGTSLSSDDVAALATTPVSIDPAGKLHACNFYESVNAKSVYIGRSGTVETAGLTEYYARCSCAIRNEPDNSRWLCMCHHAKPSSSNLFSASDSFSTSVVKDENRYFHGKLPDYQTGSWSFLVVQRASDTSPIQKYRWTQYFNPNTATYSQVSSANIDDYVSSDCGYLSFSYGGIYKKNSNAYYTANDGREGDWWGAFGSWNTITNGIPGWNGVTITNTGFIDLYISVGSIGNLPINDKCSFISPTGCCSTNGLIEM